jgi:hypothetical protein
MNVYLSSQARVCDFFDSELSGNIFFSHLWVYRDDNVRKGNTLVLYLLVAVVIAGPIFVPSRDKSHPL